MNTATRFADLGAIKNYLGILSKDGKSFHPSILRDVTGLGATDLARRTGIPRARVYEKNVPLKPTEKLVKRIVHLVIATDLVYELLGRNDSETGLWLMSPSAIFFGDTPFEICMRGEGEAIIKWLSVRAGQEPGVAF